MHTRQPVHARPRQFLIASLLTLFLGMPASVSAQTFRTVIERDSLALIALFEATGGPNWTTQSDPILGDWVFNHNDPEQPRPTAGWGGVRVLDKLVDRLFLTNNNMVGTIPAGLGSLTRPRTISIIGNSGGNGNLNGPIPDTLGSLASLEQLSLIDNALSGPIPEKLGHLKSIIQLRLAFNQLTGAVPESFTQLTTLQILTLHKNELESLPDLSGLPALQHVNVHSNRLTFKDLEPIANNPNITDFVYAPQDSVDTHIFRENGEVELFVSVGGQETTYRWFRDDQEIEDATDSTYVLLDNDTAIYRAEARNPLLPNLVLFSRPVQARSSLLVVNSTGNLGLKDDAPEGVCDTGGIVVRVMLEEPECTLRAAIEVANRATDDIAQIAFDIPGSGIPEISLGPTKFDELPIVTRPVGIDGTTQPTGRVRLSGEGDIVLLFLKSSGSTVRGLEFEGDLESKGLLLAGEGGHTVEQCFFYFLNPGLRATAPGNTIRTSFFGRNRSGISITGPDATGNTVEDNEIGIDAEVPRADAGNDIGIVIGGSTNTNTYTNTYPSNSKIRNNLIAKNILGIEVGSGAFTIIEDNRIAENQQSGIFVHEAPGSKIHTTTIRGNRIGLPFDGSNLLGNGEHGIEVEGAFNTHIGGNVIAGNEGSGVFITGLGSVSTSLLDNKIGTDETGQQPFGNKGYGVLVQDLGFGFIQVNVNQISANGKSGIAVEGSGIQLEFNLIGTDSFGQDPLGVMGNTEHGVELRGLVSSPTDGSNISSNTIAFNLTTGLYLEQFAKAFIFRNHVHHNITGIGLVQIGNGVRVHSNLIERNIERGIDATAIDSLLLITQNTVRNNGGTGTGIHLTAARALIEGNEISGDAGDAITLEQGSTATITNNNLFDNQGFGLNNRDASVSIMAQGNWWGDASGPAGQGPGTGEAVSTGVDFANWRGDGVAVVLAPEADEVILPVAEADTVALFAQNWQARDDVLNVSVSDERGWLLGPPTFAVTIEDSLGAVARLPVLIPAGTPDGVTSTVEAIATSQADARHADTTTVTLIALTAALAQLAVLPEEAQVAPGDTVQFAALGFDQFSRTLAVTPTWSATGGTIDEDGLYVAGPMEGTFQVTASAGGLEARAVVTNGILVATEGEAVPETFALAQNYPNPFNPVTTIVYTLPQPERVRVAVYDVLGRDVAVLVDALRETGTHQAHFDASRLASGVYFYRMTAGPFSRTRTMVLLR